jgi:predicted unusual protein kinase regulating ubiquinone biosynthesis (AarF/ABC1/UbiB family)
VLLSPVRLGPDGPNILAQLEDVESMLSLEVDYGAEAENMRVAARTLSGLDGVQVPAVHEKFSTPRVLTMDWVEGRHVGAFMAGGPSRAESDRLGELMSRAFMRLCYRAHLLYCDLHPGNYLFMPDGRLGLIDFGCARRYTPAEVEYLTRAERAGFESSQAVRDALTQGADLTERQRQDRERMDLMEAWYDWMCEPTRTTEAFDFSNEEYLRRGMEIWRQLLRRRFVRSIPVNAWIAKSFIGLRAMLLKLRARVALGRVLREETSVALP